MVVYPGVQHGFFCEDRPASFDRHARDDAWTRMLALFDATLKPPKSA